MIIYKNPWTLYEKFVNAFCIKEKHYPNREELTKEASVKWHEIKDNTDYVNEYIASAPKPKYHQMRLQFTQIATSPAVVVGSDAASNNRSSLPSSKASSSNSRYLPGLNDIVTAPVDSSLSKPNDFEVRKVAKYFTKNCPALSTEDVLQNVSFISAFSKSVNLLSEYQSLAEIYLGERHRKSPKKTCYRTIFQSLQML